jgi:two-component system, cell cycle sensor histidine kinase and response regulator CckA
VRVAATSPDPIQLLLTDLVRPHLNGRLLAEQLNRAYPHLKILFMSGYTDNTLDRTGLSQDKVNFLQKPFSPMILAQQVRQILDANK